MKRLITILGIALLCNSYSSFAQKPVLDTSAFTHWASVSDPAISNNGRFVIYNEIETAGALTNVKLLVKDLTSSRTLAINDIRATGARFSENSNLLFFKDKAQQLNILNLESFKNEVIKNVNDFQLIKIAKDESLIYYTSDSSLIIKNLRTGKVFQSKQVIAYWLSKDNRYLVQQGATGKAGEQVLRILDLKNFKAKRIWHGNGIGQLKFDRHNKSAAFEVKNAKTNQIESLWYVNLKKAQANKIWDGSGSLPAGLHIEGLRSLGNDARYVYLNLKGEELPKPASNAIMVDVWGYQDKILQSQQLRLVDERRVYLAALELSTGVLQQLEHENEDLIPNENEDLNRDLFLLVRAKGHIGEAYWNAESQVKSCLISSADAFKPKQLPDLMRNPFFSPSTKYIVYNDLDNHLRTYDIDLGVVQEISRRIPVNNMDSIDANWGFIHKSNLSGISGFAPHDQAVYISDRYDIWKVNLFGPERIVNLTNGFGRKNNISFNFLTEGYNAQSQLIPENAKLTLRAVDHNTLKSGFLNVHSGKPNLDPKKLHMSESNFVTPFGGQMVTTSLDQTQHLVLMSQGNRTPNLFVTKDFKTFKSLSSVYPERNWNWLIAELVAFKTSNGKVQKGALYKPENFVPGKKYPVIVTYYEKEADHIFHYKKPREVNGLMDIPWFVSRGYLVFVPNFNYRLGRVAQDVSNTLDGAWDYLSKLPFVESTRIGLQGHSFSGYETNIAITKSRKFAAAVSGAGVSDMISFTGGLSQEGNSSQFWEQTQNRIATTLWDRPDLYINNSPIFEVDKITTPVLILSCKKDRLVPFEQGIEFFTALRRLGKRAWMLQYDNGGHSVSGAEALDYTLRMTQFFDHYLKGAPAPLWMLDGIPAKYKGLKTGLELDTLGRTPGPGLNTAEDAKKIEGYSKIPLSEKLKRFQN